MRDRTSSILHICVHLDLICLLWPYHFVSRSFTTRNCHVYIRAPCRLCICTCPHELHITHMCQSRPHLSNVALPFRWRLIYHTKLIIDMCTLEHNAICAFARLHASSILHIRVHQDFIRPTWPYYSVGGSFMTRNRHVYITAPCRLCICTCPYVLHITHVYTYKS